MTKDKTDSTEDLMARVQLHDGLDAWLKGKGIDAALKAMNESAAAKKPGRVVKRVGKALGDIFSSPRVISWEKGKKTVYCSSMTRSEITDVVIPGSYAIPTGRAIFQTDLYFRANQEVTEINASTVSGIRQEALEQLARIRGGDDEALEAKMQIALTLARIFQTGFKDSGLPEDEPRQFLVPYEGDALVVISLPINRVEFDEEMVGQVALISRIIPGDEVSSDERSLLDEMKSALTREGHPGAEEFGKMIEIRARPVDPSLF